MENQKQEPSPSWLVTPISPSMASTRPLQMARPRPVPPNLRVVESSIWENRWNRLPSWSAGMPGPVSVTSILNLAVPAS